VVVKTASSSRIIPKEGLGVFGRWELHSFDSGKPQTQHQQESDEIKRQMAFARAYEEGMQAGRAAAASIVADESARVAALLDSAGAAMSSFAADVARETVDLAVAIARQMVRRELSLNPDLIVDIVRESMTYATQDEHNPVLQLHPIDAALIKTRIGGELSHGRWHIAEEPGISPGGCRISAPGGDVDATLESRWAAVLAAIETDDEHRKW